MGEGIRLGLPMPGGMLLLVNLESVQIMLRFSYSGVFAATFTVVLCGLSLVMWCIRNLM